MGNLEDTARILDDLHSRWTPHSGQIKAGKPLINDEVRQVFLECGRNFGKALALDTKVVTPKGMVEIGAIKSGDHVIGADGRPHEVLIAHDVLHDRPCYEIEFVSGQKVVACEDHLWEVKSLFARKHGHEPSVLKTKDMARNVIRNKEYNYHIRRTDPVHYARQTDPLEVEPYVLGAWLGNGTSAAGGFCTPDQDTIEEIMARGYVVTKQARRFQYGILGLKVQLADLGLIKNKHIPEKYKISSIEERLALIRGLMDTDGTINKKTGMVMFHQSNEQMARDVYEIVSSLGERPTIKSKIPTINGKPYERAWHVGWTPVNYNPFCLKRKSEHLCFKDARSRSHSIKSIKPVQSVPVRCLTVDAQDSLFLITESFIPTHNTDLMAYLFWRFANLHPGSENYYFAPLQNQGREIIWEPRRLQDFGNPNWIESINEVEMRITFTNGSFVKVDGSDNIDKYRGVKITKGGLIGFDEYKDFRPNFYSVIDPNLLNAYLLIVGTPPETDSHFTTDADEFAANPKKRYFNMPSETNPHISREWLAGKKEELYRKGDGPVWEREYMAKRVKGGKSAILPQANSIEMRSQVTILRSILRDKKKLNWYCIADPGTATCFGVMFLAVNPYSKKIHVLETIYEKDQSKTGVTQIGPRIIETKNRLCPDVEWVMVADEAAAWFIKEMYDNYEVSFGSSNKADNAKENGLGLMKDIMLAGLLEIAGRPERSNAIKIEEAEQAEAFLWEMQNYVKDKHGKIPKGNDHLIDTFRYFLGEEKYQIKAEPPSQKAGESERRGYTMEEDHPEIHDITDDLDINY